MEHTAKNITVTVATVTYNRKNTLARTYESLERQTVKNFEWVVIDDGSTDGTYAYLEELQASASFPIRVYQQENKGMHIAVNRAVEVARGRFFLKLDSDDYLVPHAIERYVHWFNVEVSFQKPIAGVRSVVVDETGRQVTGTLPASPWIGDSIQKTVVKKIKGDTKGMFLTDVMRAFPYDEQPFLTANPWMRMSLQYSFLYIDEPLYVYTTPQKDSITAGGAGNDPRTVKYRAVEVLNLLWSYFFYNPRYFWGKALTIKKAARSLGVSRWGVLRELSFPAKVIYIAADIVDTVKQ